MCAAIQFSSSKSSLRLASAGLTLLLWVTIASTSYALEPQDNGLGSSNSEAAPQSVSQAIEALANLGYLNLLVEPNVTVSGDARVSIDKTDWQSSLTELLRANGLGRRTEGAVTWITDSGSTEERQASFSGEPIDLTLQDADLVEVLQSFEAISALQVVVDQSLEGKVTIDLSQVPWDQALDAILRLHELDKTIEGDVLRIFRADDS